MKDPDHEAHRTGRSGYYLSIIKSVNLKHERKKRPRRLCAYTYRRLTPVCTSAQSDNMLTTKNIDNRKISREDQYQPAQTNRTLCWLFCRRPVVEVQQTGHVNLSFIVFNLRQKHHDQTANLTFQFQHTELLDSLFSRLYAIRCDCNGSKWKNFR